MPADSASGTSRIFAGAVICLAGAAGAWTLLGAFARPQDEAARIAAVEASVRKAEAVAPRRGGRRSPYPDQAICPGLSDDQIGRLRDGLSAAGAAITVTTLNLAPEEATGDGGRITPVRLRLEATGPYDAALTWLDRLSQARSADRVGAYQAMATPLFPLARDLAQTEVTLKLEGLVRTSRRVAALLSINGAPATWIELGGRRDGVLLRDVQTDRVVIDTARGGREVPLVDVTTPTARPDGIPPGFRMPPPPASAPSATP